MGRGVILGLAMWTCLSGAALAQTLPTCDAAQFEGLRQADGRERLAHLVAGPAEAPPLRYAFDAQKDFGFSYRFIIDETGKVTCLSPGWSGEAADGAMTAQRQAYVAVVASRHYQPFLTGGQPAKVMAQGYIYEEETPGFHVVRPKGDAATAEIDLDWSPHLVNPPGFKMRIKGDGTVTYNPGRGDLVGVQTYHIPPEQVEAMLAEAEKADFWSLRDAYAPSHPRFEGSTSVVTITIGGRTKQLVNADGGIPRDGARLIWKIADLANAGMWWQTNDETVTQMAANGFHFKSKTGHRFLMDTVADPTVPYSVVEDLVARGTPMNGLIRGYPFDQSLLDAAIDGQRLDMANRMIDQGALRGKHQKTKSTRALAHAVQSGSPILVEQILAFSPSLSIKRNDRRRAADPIITLVRQPYPKRAPTQNIIDIIQLLVDHGADINARDSYHYSLLNYASELGDSELVTWLIAKGAEVNGRSKNDIPPLFNVLDEDTAVALLDAGAIPTDDELDALVSQAKFNHQIRLETWLKAHGKWPAEMLTSAQ